MLNNSHYRDNSMLLGAQKGGQIGQKWELSTISPRQFYISVPNWKKSLGTSFTGISGELSLKKLFM